MMTTIEPCLPVETDLERIDGLLADLGTLNRRAANQTLDEDDYRTLARRMRERLKALRASYLDADDAAIELTDAGLAVASATTLGRNPDLQALLRRVPALMTAQQLADRPAVRRARFYGPVAAIDGGRS